MEHQHTPEQSRSATSRLALLATFHCLLGCGLGEIAGMMISSALMLNNLRSVVLSIILGFVAGLALGILPLIKRKIPFVQAIRVVIIGEGISIGVMELFELLTQLVIPGVMSAHLDDLLFWIGMIISLIVGFAAAFPVNMIMIRKGIRHHHHH